ncbi:MAG: HAD-IC family P-type ATPase [Clostridia bacterium]
MKKREKPEEKKQIERYMPKIEEGLNKRQIEERIKQELKNEDTSVTTKTIPQIIKNNFFTLFNFINLLLAIAIFAVGSYRNLLFLGVVICNTIISTYQEIHSKRIVDKLSLLAQSKVKAIREGKEETIQIEEIVLDDYLIFQQGNQVVVDSIILQGEAEVDESYITGESEPVHKKKGDMILSGSFLVSGKVTVRAEHVGSDNYTAKISKEAKFAKKVNSEIMNSLNKIIKFISIAIIPIGILLFISQMQIEGNTIQMAVVNSVAAIIGMIPEGLVLLTSTVLAVSVIRLSKSKVLVQQLYCIETLARVDMLCLDKTGTITEGKMEVKEIVPVEKMTKEKVEQTLAQIAKGQEDSNSTILAIKDAFTIKEKSWKVKKQIPFSSQKKWSGITFEQEGSFILGAPEFVLGQEKLEKYQEVLEEKTKEYRVLVLAKSKEDFKEKELPNTLEVMGFVLLQDKIRKEARQTLKYFKEQGVQIKIISGDNPKTVSNIAKRAGVEEYEKYIDMSKIEGEEEVEKAAREYTIFGRVSPSQKKQLVIALKKQGHTVAMTGDRGK